VGRWGPDAGGRLQQSAMALYLARGYDDVTVAEIASAAGLTKRTFFRYFADKREVLFAGAEDFQARVVAAVQAVPARTAPVDAAVSALADASAQLVQYGHCARARRDLIASSTDLQERELIKMAALAAAVAGALRERGTQHALASMAAQAAVAAFTAAYDRWVDTEGTGDLTELLLQFLHDLRQALATR
jgi:AcrR family transcriptional regulator